MIVGPVAVALVGAAVGVACCSAWLFATARDEGVDASELRQAAKMLLFGALIFAWLQLGLGSLFGASLDQLLSIDTDVRGRRRIVPLFGMWACLAAGLQAMAVSLVVSLHRRARRP